MYLHVPTMLMVESVVAVAPNKETIGLVLCAQRCIPPNAVVPEIALVTAMRGECKLEYGAKQML